jgi:Domain of unknown function (DUF4219)
LSINVKLDAENIFHRKMSSNNKQFVEIHIPTLDSSNYQVWAGKMQVYLRLQGLWNKVRGSEPNLPELGEGSKPELCEGSKPEHVAFHKKE